MKLFLEERFPWSDDPRHLAPLALERLGPKTMPKNHHNAHVPLLPPLHG